MPEDFDGAVNNVVSALTELVRREVAKQYSNANIGVLQQINTFFPIKDLDAVMFHLPDSIRKLREKVIEQRKTLRSVRQHLSDYEQDVKEAEANIMADIMAETLENGKPRFSNDKARSAQLMQLKKIDATYQNALLNLGTTKNEAESLEDDISSLEAEIKAKEMEFQGALRLIENTNQEMAIFAAMTKAGGGGGGCKCKTHTIDNHGAEESKETDANFSKEERSW